MFLIRSIVGRVRKNPIKCDLRIQTSEYVRTSAYIESRRWKNTTVLGECMFSIPILLHSPVYSTHVQTTADDISRMPHTIEEVLSRPDAAVWRATLETELINMQENQVWHLRELSADVSALGCRMLFDIKQRIWRYRYRLVAHGIIKSRAASQLNMCTCCVYGDVTSFLGDLLIWDSE